MPSVAPDQATRLAQNLKQSRRAGNRIRAAADIIDFGLIVQSGTNPDRLFADVLRVTTHLPIAAIARYLWINDWHTNAMDRQAWPRIHRPHIQPIFSATGR